MDNILTRVQALAEKCSAKTHHAHAVAATVLRQLVSDNKPSRKWTAVVAALGKLSSKEAAELILKFAEALHTLPAPVKKVKVDESAPE